MNNTNPTKTRDKRMCSGRVSSSCSTSCTVLLCVLEQPGVDNSSAGPLSSRPNWKHFVKLAYDRPWLRRWTSDYKFNTTDRDLNPLQLFQKPAQGLVFQWLFRYICQGIPRPLNLVVEIQLPNAEIKPQENKQYTIGTVTKFNRKII